MTPLIKLTDIGKRYGSVIALRGVSLSVAAGEVTCVLGDNGAGKSTLIKIVSGVHQPDEGSFEVAGEPVSFASPRDALAHGIATVYQDLAVVPLMPVWRNFFLGSERRRGLGRIDVDFMRRTTKSELLEMGIDLRYVDQPIGTLSGGERQCVAIARAVYFGAKVLILDEPTAALGSPRCSSWTSRQPRSASNRRASCCATSCRPASAGSASSSSPTTRTTPTRSATAS